MQCGAKRLSGFRINAAQRGEYQRGAIFCFLQLHVRSYKPRVFVYLQSTAPCHATENQNRKFILVANGKYATKKSRGDTLG